MTKPLAEQTPVEIDTQLAALYNEEQRAENRLASAMVSIHHAAGDRRSWDKSQRWGLTFSQAVDKVEAMLDSDKPWVVKEARQALDRLDAAKASLREVREQAEVFNAEFDRRGGWTRAFLATSSTNPHVHNGMDCSTCNKMGKKTLFGWFPQYSGLPESQIVEDAGERACTTCYPSAPVGTLSRPTKFFTDEEKDKAKAREEREAKKAKAEAEKVVVEGIREYGDRAQTKEFKTLRAATQFATSARADIISWGPTHPSAPRWEANALLVEAAIAAKTGRPVEEVTEEITAKSVLTAKRRG